MKRLFLLTIFALLIFATQAIAMQGPKETLMQPIDKVLDILESPAYAEATQKEAQKEELWQVISGFFDFTEVSKRALGRNWRIFTVEERQNFRDVFSRFLANTYIAQIQGNFTGEKISYLEERHLSETKAVVKTVIIRDTIQIPIDYSLLQKKGGWKIYDINVEGVSLVQNYRSQFRKILMKSTPQELIERLEQKLKSQTKDDTI